MHTMKNITKKQFTSKHLSDCEYIKDIYRTKYMLEPINNIILILEKLKTSPKGQYVECGTFQGKTLIPAALYCEQNNLFQDRLLIGMDSFEGFPISKHHPNDLPIMFQHLWSTGSITEDHYEKAKIRTDNFNSLKHLEGEYFLNIGNIFNSCNDFNNVKLIKGLFKDTTPLFTEDIGILHLDGDLYESYLLCLENLYDNVVEGGVVIFDEYYSHKYPGARIAVNEFFENKQGHFEMWLTNENHERWCWIKE